jgi:hypothetical protein
MKNINAYTSNLEGYITILSKLTHNKELIK